jgi:hypothetical protein
MLDEIFDGCRWVALDVQPDGSIEPPPKTRPARETISVHSAFHLGPRVYTVVNFTKGYQCFVQFRAEGQPQGRCNHPPCCEYRPRICKHIRRACKWHVTFVRRSKRLQASLKGELTHNGKLPKH